LSSSDIKYFNKFFTGIIEKFNANKKEVDNIVNLVREEHLETREELDKTYRNIGELTNEVEEIDIKSEDLHMYLKKDIQHAHKNALEIQNKYYQLQFKAKLLKQKKDRLENRYGKLSEIGGKAENLSIQISDTISYITRNLKNIYKLINEFQNKNDVVKAIIKAQEEERKSIAREIHDGPAQAISNVVIRAEICKQLWSDKDSLIEELDGLSETANNSLEDIRRIIFDLRPMHLDDLGLIYAVRKYCEEFEKLTGIDIDIECSGDEKRLEDMLEISIFRIIQEILNNVRKHSQADKINIQFNSTPLNISVKITDNGIGFDLEKIDYSKHFGIKGMCERVNLLKGVISIKSKINKGTFIFMEIPVK